MTTQSHASGSAPASIPTPAPSPAPAAEPQWLCLGEADQIPERVARTVATAAGEIAVFRTGDGRLFALANRCPHKGGQLAEGIVHGQRVTCPMHGLVMDLESGIAVPPDVGCTQRFPVCEDAGQIWLGLPPP
jgi:nitrite reductase (NADH) small subunit